MKIINLFILSIFFIWSIRTNAQKQGYSQFNNSPLNLNPSLTGVTEANWRIISNFRSQNYFYGESLNTISFSFDKNMSTEYGKLGIGLLFNHDSSLGNGIPTTQFYISGSGIVRLSKKIYIASGIQLGYVNRTSSLQHMSFPEQYDRNIGDFNTTLPNNENFNIESSDYVDVNIGTSMWSVQDNIEYLFGMSFHHLNNPKDYFLEENKIGIGINFHGSFSHKLNSKTFIKPLFLLGHNKKVLEYLLGSSIGILDKSASNLMLNQISIGGYLRAGNNHFESAIIVLGLGVNNWKTYISTDLDISGLKTKNFYSNALEISFIYYRPYAILKKLSLPCIRY